MARALFPSVVARLPGDLRQSAASSEPPSLADADRLLALTPFDRRRVARQVGEWLSQPPFTYQLGNDQQVREIQREATSTSHDSAETAADYRWAIARAPGDRWLRFNYGVFLEEREPARSAAEFAAALQILPGDYRTREKLVDELLRLGKFTEAIDQCRELLRRMPYHAPAYLTIAYALTQLGSLDESISAYKRAIHLQPTFAVDGYNQIGIVELHQGRLAAAVASFQKAIDLDKGHTRLAELQRNLSYAREELANLR
jgi:tetratricopeptide (TPR) repeat protein